MTSEKAHSYIDKSQVQLPEETILQMLGGARTVVDGLTLDAATQLLIKLVIGLGLPPLEQQSPEEARAMYKVRVAAMGSPPRAMKQVIDRTIPGLEGLIPVRIYVPNAPTGDLPGLVYYHGGGFVIGDLDTHDGPCRMIADDAGCVVVAVDYRLAPEHKFPAALDDALWAFNWVVRNARELGIDPRRVAVGGDSAGGGLATVVARGALMAAQAARDFERPLPSFQLLIYPVTDLTMSSHSYEVCGAGFLLTKRGMEWFRDHYLSSEDEQRHPFASPSFAEDLTGLPPALVITAGFDPLRDEGREYAGRLRAAGVQVTEHCSETLVHGFLTMTGGLATAEREVEWITTQLRTGLHQNRSPQQEASSNGR